MAIWTSEVKELEKLYESLKGQLPELEKELGQLIKTEDANVILLYSRRCLEVIITDLCECELKRPRKTEPLKGIIDKLQKEEKVPSHIIASMHGLNELSTYGAHPKDFDPRQVRTTLINLETIIEWYLKYKGIDIKGEEEIQFKGESSEEVKKEARIEEQEKPTKSLKQKLLSGVLITAIVVIAAIFAYPKIFKQDTLEKLRSSGERISVVVIPFLNMTNDTTWNIWQDGVQNEIITSLTNSEELKVRQTESITSMIQSEGLTNYASITPSLAKSISQKLNANIFIYGSIKQVGKTIRVNAQLIDSNTEDSFKSFQIDGTTDKILYITDSLSNQIKNYLIVSVLGKEVTSDFQQLTSTRSPEAYRLFITADKFYTKGNFLTAAKLFAQAITIDSNFVMAALQLSLAYGHLGMSEQNKKWLLYAYNKKDQMSLRQSLYTDYLYAGTFEKSQRECIKYLKQLLEVDDQVAFVHFQLGLAFYDSWQYENAIPELEKAIDLYHSYGSKPRWSYNYILLMDAYYKTGQYKKEKELFEKAEKDFPDDPNGVQRQTLLALTEGKTEDANEYFEKYKSIQSSNSASEADIKAGLAWIYSEAGIFDKAESYWREALSLEPNPWRMYQLAWLLIEKDRNINEGIELIDKALESSPENNNYLHCKGWGLYKQGKYNEALEFLQISYDLYPFENATYLHLQAAKKAVAGQKIN